MSEPWWVQATPAEQKYLRTGPLGLTPRLVDDDAPSIADDLLTRRTGFTPEWAPVDGVDAGAALVKLYGEQATLIAQRLNRVPDKAKIELYRAAGVEPLGARSAEALVEFTLAPAATESVLVPAGFQLGAAPADGSSGQVIFETQEQVFATSAKIGALQAQSGASLLALPVPEGTDAAGFLPFPSDSQPGDALRIGLDGPAAPTRGLTLLVKLASIDEIPRPHSEGGFTPSMPTVPAGAALFQWEVLSENGAEPIEVLRDETKSFTESGMIEFRLPVRWDAFIAPGGNKAMRWLRVRLVQGRIAAPPRVTAIRVNMSRACAVRTIRNEIPEQIASSYPTQMRLSQRPIVPGSVMLEVDEGAGAPPIAWREVVDLSDFGPEDRVFSVDAAQGVLIFGAGVHGRAVPDGFRNVRVLQYQVASGRAGKVGPGAIRTLVQSAQFLTGVSNPWPASGGVDADDAAMVVRTAPKQMQSRGRAVAVADFGILALSTPGAEVRRAQALPGRHPSFPGRFLPGVVAVVVVPPLLGQGPPLPDAAALFLTSQACAAGVQVVACAPRYRRLQAEIGFLAGPAQSIAEMMRQIIETLNSFVDPLEGGNDGVGWPFAQPLQFHALERRLLQSIEGLRALPKLRLTLDGVPQLACADVNLGRAELFWPAQHTVYPYPPEAGS
jgi:predicted phage baseplate assembly protein